MSTHVDAAAAAIQSIYIPPSTRRSSPARGDTHTATRHRSVSCFLPAQAIRHHVGDAGVGRGGRGQGRRRGGDPRAGRGHAGLAGGVAVPHRTAAAAPATGVRHRGGTARDGAQAQAPRRPPPRLLRERRASGPGQVQGRLLPRVHRLPRGQRPRLPGSGGGAGRVHGGLRPRWLRAERPQPEPVRQERGAGRGGARGRAGARPQVLRHRHLPRLPCRLGRPQVHTRQDRRRSDDGAGGELLVAGIPSGAGGGGVREAGGGGPVGAAGVAPRAGHPPLVDGAELAAHVDGGGRHDAAAQRARRRDPAQHAGGRHVPAEAGAGDAAGDPRVLLPRHDGHVRQMGVRPHGAAGAAVPRAPVAGRRGRPRPRRAAEVPRQQARLGQLPRAPRHRTLPVGGARARRHRPQDRFRSEAVTTNSSSRRMDGAKLKVY